MEASIKLCDDRMVFKSSNGSLQLITGSKGLSGELLFRDRSGSYQRATSWEKLDQMDYATKLRDSIARETKSKTVQRQTKKLEAIKDRAFEYTSTSGREKKRAISKFEEGKKIVETLADHLWKKLGQGSISADDWTEYRMKRAFISDPQEMAEIAKQILRKGKD